MRYMLDTNVLIYLIKNKSIEIISHINEMNDSDTLSMSFISYAELLKGAEGSIKRELVLKKLQHSRRRYLLRTKLIKSFAQSTQNI